MKTKKKRSNLPAAMIALTNIPRLMRARPMMASWLAGLSGWCLSQERGITRGNPLQEEVMPKFIIEREIPGAGQLGPAELQAISSKSCGVIRDLNRSGRDVQWVQSFVTDDKIYCVYNAPDEQAVREHAERGGFPANVIARVGQVIDPTTAEQPAAVS
jgi:hypothetical protein